MDLKTELAKLKRKVKKDGPAAAARELLPQPRPAGLAEAALVAHPELLPHAAGYIVDEADTLDPSVVATALTVYESKLPGEWFRGWNEFVDTIVTSAYLRAPKAFTSIAPTETARIGLLLVRGRLGEVPANALRELDAVLLGGDFGLYYVPRRTVTKVGMVAVAVSAANVPQIASVYAPLFGSEAAFAAAVRATIIASADTQLPRRDRIPHALVGATDDELAKLLDIGETPQHGGHQLPFDAFIEAVRASGIPASRFAAIAKRLGPDANGASLAAWAALAIGGASVFDNALGQCVDLRPCQIMAMVYGTVHRHIPLMQDVLAAIPRDAVRSIVERSFCKGEQWQSGFFGARYLIAYAFLDYFDGREMLERYRADFQVAHYESEYGRNEHLWSAVYFASPRKAVELFELGVAEEDDALKDLAVSMLATYAGVRGQLPDGIDAVLEHAVDQRSSDIGEIARGLDAARRQRLIAETKQRALADAAWARVYAEAMGDRVDANAIEELAKKKALARSVLMSVLTSCKDPASIDPWMPATIDKLGVKITKDEREMLVDHIGAERVDRWWTPPPAKASKRRSATQ